MNKEKPILTLNHKVDRQKLKGLVIFDRDNTLIVDIPGLAKSDEIAWFPGRLECLEYLASNGFEIAIATNQSAIGFGQLTLSNYLKVTSHLIHQLNENHSPISIIAACPHQYERQSREPLCNCRKPKPGLLDAIITNGQILPKRILFVGDSLTDKEAAMESIYEIDFLYSSLDEMEFSQSIGEWAEKGVGS